MQKYYVEVNDNNTCCWYSDVDCTTRHRVGAPAVEYASGSDEWWLNGKRHSDNGPAVEYADGLKVWYVNGDRHRINGPAYEGANGYKAWWVNGKRHRVDGPAIEYTPGEGRKEWWLDGVRMTKKEHAAHTAPAQEMTVAQIEAALGERIKIVK